jgi:hypothetical protein
MGDQIDQDTTGAFFRYVAYIVPPERVDCSWGQRLGCNHRSDQKGPLAKPKGTPFTLNRDGKGPLPAGE